jgi:general secretion pathway protein G
MSKVAAFLSWEPIASKYRNERLRTFKGFTLIELLVVLAVIATLLTFVAPKYFNQIEASKEAVLLDNLHSTREVINKFYADLGRYPDSLDELVEKNYLRSLPYDPVADSKTNWQIIAVPTGYKGNVFDLKSGAAGLSRKGEAYDQW